MRKVSFTVRPMLPEDISEAIQLSAAENWNQTENDWRLLIENSANSCLVAESDNKVIGTTTAINYSNKVSWIGMVLVNRNYRGLGVSKSLLSTILTKIESCKYVKLDATPAGQPVYQRFGFKEEYFIDRMTNASVNNLAFEKHDEMPEPIQLKDIHEVVAFDGLVFGANRHQLIEFLVKQYPDCGWMLKQDNALTGFIFGRDGNRYHQIGPVVAETFTAAKILISSALEHLSGKPVVIDVLCDKEGLINWLKEIGFVKQRHFVRMYKEKNDFPGVIDKLYSICGPEFG